MLSSLPFPTLYIVGVLSATLMTAPKEYLQSGHALVRALKAPDDPPRPAWPTKIVIATEAWHCNDFYLPNKAEILRDWILDSWSHTEPK